MFPKRRPAQIFTDVFNNGGLYAGMRAAAGSIKPLMTEDRM